VKIGVLTHNYPRFPGDFSGHFVAALSQELARRGHQITVVAPYDPAYVSETLAGPVRFCFYRYAWPESRHHLGYMRTMQADVAMRRETYFWAPFLFLFGWRCLYTWARRERPDVFHAHWILPNGFLGAVVSRQLGIPLVVSIPGSDALVSAQNGLFRAMARFALRQARSITANSADLRQVAVERLGADPERFDLIVYGVDPQALQPRRGGVAGLRARLGLPDDAVVLLGVGRMVYKKGFDVLIRALGLLRRRVEPDLPPLRVVLVGSGDLLTAWQHLAEQEGVADWVRWPGVVPRDEIETYYNLADVFVMPAVVKPETGLAVAVLDAMSCGRPIIATEVAGNPLVVRDGDNGLLVPEQDAVALADAISRLASDPDLRARMGRRSRQRVEEEFGWPQLAARYEAHFRRITNLK